MTGGTLAKMSTPRPGGVSGVWRVVAIGLAVGVAAHVALSLRRPAVVEPSVVVTVRDVATAARTDPRLDRVLDVADFDKATLADVLRSLGDRGGINVAPELGPG